MIPNKKICAHLLFGVIQNFSPPTRWKINGVLSPPTADGTHLGRTCHPIIRDCENHHHPKKGRLFPGEKGWHLGGVGPLDSHDRTCNMPNQVLPVVTKTFGGFMMKLVTIVLFKQVIFRFQPLIFQDVGDQVGSRLEEAGRVCFFFEQRAWKKPSQYPGT